MAHLWAALKNRASLLDDTANRERHVAAAVSAITVTDVVRTRRRHSTPIRDSWVMVGGKATPRSALTRGSWLRSVLFYSHPGSWTFETFSYLRRRCRPNDHVSKLELELKRRRTNDMAQDAGRYDFSRCRADSASPSRYRPERSASAVQERENLRRSRR